MKKLLLVVCTFFILLGIGVNASSLEIFETVLDFNSLREVVKWNLKIEEMSPGQVKVSWGKNWKEIRGQIKPIKSSSRVRYQSDGKYVQYYDNIVVDYYDCWKKYQVKRGEEYLYDSMRIWVNIDINSSFFTKELIKELETGAYIEGTMSGYVKKENDNYYLLNVTIFIDTINNKKVVKKNS